MEGIRLKKVREYILKGCLLVFLLFLVGCQGTPNETEIEKTEETALTEEQGQDDTAEAIEGQGESEEIEGEKPKGSLLSIEEAAKLITESGDVDGIVLLGEGYRFNLPLIPAEERDDVYDRMQYQPFTVKLDGQVLREEPKGNFILEEPIIGMRELLLEYADGSERTVNILFLHSYDLAVIPDASEVKEIAPELSIYSYYRMPMIAISEKYLNMQTGWSIFLQEAIGEPMMLYSAYQESGSTDSFVNLDYEVVGDEKALSFIFVDRYGIAMTPDDHTRVKVRHMSTKGFTLLENAEWLSLYDLTEEDIMAKVNQRISEGPISVQGENYELLPMQSDDFQDAVVFLKNTDLYIELFYGVDGEPIGREIVNVGKIK